MEKKNFPSLSSYKTKSRQTLSSTNSPKTNMFNDSVALRMATCTSLFFHARRATKKCLSKRATSRNKSLQSVKRRQSDKRNFRSLSSRTVSVWPACSTATTGTTCTNYTANSTSAATVAMDASLSAAKSTVQHHPKKVMKPKTPQHHHSHHSSRVNLTVTRTTSTITPFSTFIACAKSLTQPS